MTSRTAHAQPWPSTRWRRAQCRSRGAAGPPRHAARRRSRCTRASRGRPATDMVPRHARSLPDDANSWLGACGLEPTAPPEKKKRDGIVHRHSSLPSFPSPSPSPSSLPCIIIVHHHDHSDGSGGGIGAVGPDVYVRRENSLAYMAGGVDGTAPAHRAHHAGQGV